jgi:hypothetical protein
MDDLRKPLLFAALGLIGIVVLLEIGAAGFLPRAASNDADLRVAIEENFAAELASLNAAQREARVQQLLLELKRRQGQERAPGLGVPYLAALDAILLFTVALMAAGLLVPESALGRLQGALTLIVAALLIVAGVVLIVAAISLLVFMLSLLLAAPFGTIAYLAAFGFFNRTGASAVLSLIFLLKVAFAVALVLAQPRFLQNRGLVLMVLTSILAYVVVSFLHGFVPRPLVSVTDAIAAILVMVLGVVWAAILLVGAVVAISKAVRVDRGLA